MEEDSVPFSVASRGSVPFSVAIGFTGATPVAVPRSVRDSEFDTDSVPGIDRRTRRRLSLVWRSQTTDSVPQNHAPDLSLSRVRRAMQLEHQRSGMVLPRLATQATLVDSDMGDLFRDERHRHQAPSRQKCSRCPTTQTLSCCHPGRLWCPAGSFWLFFLQAHLDLSRISWVEWEQVRRVGVG